MILHDPLPGRHSAVAVFLNKDIDSNRQESKTDSSTFWTFRFWYFSYCPMNKFDLPFCFRHGLYTLVFYDRINSYLAIKIVKKY